MKKFLIILFLLLSITSWTIAQEHPLIIGTYNIRYKNVEDGENSWDNRKEYIKALIRFYEFDIFGAQEAVFDQVNDLLEMKEFGYVGSGRDDGKTQGEFSPVFYKKGRFELKGSGTFWLSETPDVPSKGWDALLNRVCTWVKLEDKQTKKTFYVFNTHFDHRGYQAREKSAELLVRKIKEIAGTNPLFLTGDFNSTDETKAVQTINVVLADSKSKSLLAPYGPDATAHGFDACKESRHRIDYIFVAPSIKVLKHGTINDSNNFRYPSDHAAVMIKAVIK